MTSKIAFAGRRRAKTFWFLTVASVFGAAILSSPGSIFAEDVDDQRQDAPFTTAGIDPQVAPQDEQVADVGSARTPAQAKNRAVFNMSHVERIRLRIWGNSDLGGDYAIDPDNSLSIPRVGRIEVGDMTLAELELLLSEKLSVATRTDVTVAVEVARYRPYFIMGHVAEAGAIEWRPGLKVIQAISLARGVLRPTDGTAAAAGYTHPIANRQSRTQLTFVLAQLARLKAEREGGDVVATTERIATMVKSVPETSRMALTSLMSRQNDMLSEQRRLMDAQIVGLRREREAAERELEAAQSQDKAIREQLDITRAQLANIEVLKEKKLVSNTRYLDQKSNLLQIEVRHAETASMVERARARLSNVDQQLVTVPQQRRADLNERIDGLEREVAQLELATGIETSTGDDGNAQEDVLRLSYHVARESETGVRTFPATVFTEIMPGDVLIVSDGQDRIGAVRDIERNSPAGGGIKDASAEDAQRMIEDAAVDAFSAHIRRTSDAGGR